MGRTGFYKGKHYTEYVDKVKSLKRAGNQDKAEKLLLKLVNAVEEEARAEGHGVAPWYYEQLAIVYRKRKDPTKEVAILDRYLAKVSREEAEQNTTGRELLDRLKKARALLEADSAKPVSLCPYCGIDITPPPKATGKCPICGEKVVMAKRPGEEVASLFTIDQAEKNKKAVELARAQKRALDHARKIGCTDSEFAAKERELAKKWGKPPSPNDVFWGLSNELVTKFPSFDKYSRWSKLYFIYEHQARVLFEEGRPHVHVAKEASKAYVRHLEEQCRKLGLKQEVYIATRKECCPECAKLAGQRMSFTEALDTLPIPNERCVHRRCQCSWKIDYGEA